MDTLKNKLCICYTFKSENPPSFVNNVVLITRDVHRAADFPYDYMKEHPDCSELLMQESVEFYDET